MPAPASSTERVQFGVFELDLQRAELRKQGVKVKLQEQPLKVLQVLLENPGQIVSRDELRQRVWPANTFVEFDQGLYSAMARLRDALGDSADSPRFIETVARRGYRFIAPAGDVKPQAKPKPGLSNAPAIRRGIYSLLGGLLGGALLLVSILSLDIGGIREWLRSRSTPIRSIAVLPLENLSGDPQQEYFADGMSDELITDLARLGDLRIVSRTSVMRYKKSDKPLPQIAKELNVDAVIEGTVERSANRVRIRVQLIQAATDRHLWAQSYDRELQDTLLLQSGAAADIAREIQLKLTPPQKQQLAAVRKVDPDAYEAYLKGRYFANKPSPQTLNRAIGYFDQAIAKDPSYAAAYAGLADAMVEQIFNGTSGQELREKASLAAQKAIELDPSLPEAHDALAGIREFFDWNWASAEKEYQRAIQLNPNSAAARQDYALFLGFQGRFEEAFQESQRSQELDPLSPFIRNTYCLELAVARRYSEAIAKCQQAAEFQSDYEGPYGNLFIVYVAMGNYDQALEQDSRRMAMEGKNSIQIDGLRNAYLKRGGRGFLCELIKQQKHARADAIEIASLYSLLGDKAEAFDWLQKALQQRSPMMELLKEHPYFDNLRSDPRFTDVTKQVGLSQ